MLSQKLQLGLVVLVVSIAPSLQHGFLWEPVSRSTAWRKGFNTPPNYSDNQLNCGGFGHQWGNNDGQCGECGDAWDLDVAAGERPNQYPGTYATGTIVEEYQQGQMIDATVQITAMHQGWYEFRLCPVNDPTVAVTWDCLNQNLLEFEDGTTRYNIGTESVGSYTFRLRLPADLSCSQCVLQWMWHCGNNWGEDADGTGCVGCGPQEQFYGCADVAITATDGSTSDPTEGTTTSSAPDTTTTEGTEETTTVVVTEATTTEATTTTQATTTTTAEEATTTTQAATTTTQAAGGNCFWVGVEGAGTDEWCVLNCNNVPVFCPEDMCLCEE